LKIGHRPPSVTAFDADPVAAAQLLSKTTPPLEALLTVTFTEALVVLFPAASRATAVRV
jgi:hypothetical protein